MTIDKRDPATPGAITSDFFTAVGVRTSPGVYSPEAARKVLDGLSDSQKAIINGLANDIPNSTLCTTLKISKLTLKKLMSAAIETTGAESSEQLVFIALIARHSDAETNNPESARNLEEPGYNAG